MLKCTFCTKTFCNNHSLNQHVKTRHEEEWPKYKDLQVKAKMEKFKFHCECGLNFNVEKNFHQHNKMCQGDTSRMITLKCPECSSLIPKVSIINHFENDHDIKIETEIKEFDSFESFSAWKIDYQTKFKCSFIKNTGTMNVKDGKLYSFVCNRSGNFISKSKNIRKLKIRGSIKLNSYCPATLHVTKKETKCTCKIVHTHVGHKDELRRCRFTKSERESIAEKIRQGVGFDHIIDDIRNSYQSEANRINLITDVDLHNMAANFCLNDDFTATEELINELGSSVLYYKNQASVCENYSFLNKEDFILIISSDVQADVLRRFGDSIVCIDSTHDTAPENFQLTTLMTIDDIHQGFPCVFMISNRIDRLTVEILFNEIKLKICNLNTKVFMSDMVSAYYTAFEAVFGQPQHRLYCLWDVDNRWRENLSRIETDEKKILVYKMLKTIMHESDEVGFLKMLQYFVSYLESDLDLPAFRKYFKNFENSKEQWSYAYRVNYHTSTYDHLESLHIALKYIYFNKEYTPSVNQSIKVLMVFIRDKLIATNKDKLALKLSNIRSTHKQMLMMSTEIRVEEGYFVIDNYKIKQLLDNCQCDLRCEKCNACIHEFACTCLDYLVDWNMCKHIHYLASKRDTDENHYELVDHSTCSDQFDDDGFSNNFTNDIEQINPSERRDHIIDRLKQIGELCYDKDLRIVELYCDKIEKQLSLPERITNTPTQKRHFVPQKRFISTKKKKVITLTDV